MVVVLATISDRENNIERNATTDRKYYVVAVAVMVEAITVATAHLVMMHWTKYFLILNTIGNITEEDNSDSNIS